VWKLQSLELAAGLVGITRPDSYTVEFKDASVLAVKADCNVCSGPYSISGESLQIGPLACTRAFCGAASQDTSFLDILGSARSLGVRGIELSIDSPKGVARFNR
jgi:heat shock protein HslJ